MGVPLLAESASMAYCIDISPLWLNTQPISRGVWSSHMKDMGDEEVYSSGDGPSNGATKDVKKSS